MQLLESSDVFKWMQVLLKKCIWIIRIKLNSDLVFLYFSFSRTAYFKNKWFILQCQHLRHLICRAILVVPWQKYILYNLNYLFIIWFVYQNLIRIEKVLENELIIPKFIYVHTNYIFKAEVILNGTKQFSKLYN